MSTSLSNQWSAAGSPESDSTNRGHAVQSGETKLRVCGRARVLVTTARASTIILRELGSK